MVLNIKVKGDNMEKRHSELGVLSFVSSILGLVCVGLIFICSIGAEIIYASTLFCAFFFSRL